MTSEKDIHLLQVNECYIPKRKSKLTSKENKKIRVLFLTLPKPILYLIFLRTTFITNANFQYSRAFYKPKVSIILTVHQSDIKEATTKCVPFDITLFITCQILKSQTLTYAYGNSCAGQNKNNYLFKIFHLLVMKERKIVGVTCAFPVSVHS